MKKSYYRSLGEVEILDVRKLGVSEIHSLFESVVNTLKSIIKKKGNLTDIEWEELDEGFMDGWEISFGFISQKNASSPFNKYPSIHTVTIKGPKPDKDTIKKAIKDQLEEQESEKETLASIIHTKFNPWG